MLNQCFICGLSNSHVLQEHHIVPRRHGGSDYEENLVKLCASCHQAVEKLYNEDFYTRLSINRDKGVPESDIRDLYETVNNIAREKKQDFEGEFGYYPDTKFRAAITDEESQNLGHGEYAGYALGFATAASCIAEILDSKLPEETSEESDKPRVE